MLSDCPDQWLDRPIDEETVKKLVEKIQEHSSLQTETQSWLAVTNFCKADLAPGQSVKDLLNGSDVRIIGGRHRHAAYLKVSYFASCSLIEMDWGGGRVRSATISGWREGLVSVQKRKARNCIHSFIYCFLIVTFFQC